jgi:DNA gyrase subunit A
MLVTAQGVTKRTDVAHITNLRKSGIAIIDLDDGDELLSADIVTDNDEILLVSREAQSIRFAVSDVRIMGRAAGGVKAMTLKNDIIVASAKISKENKLGSLLVVSTHGYGKKTELSEYKVQGRGGSGVGTLNVTDKTGVLVGAVIVIDTDIELIAMSSKGQVVRTALEQIPVLGRTTQGVRIMKLREGDTLAGLALL